MPGLASKLSGPAFDLLLEDLRTLSAEPTLEQIVDVMVRHGIKSPTSKNGRPSRMAATTLRDGPFRRYTERLNAGRETREQLCAAAGAGVHPLDAIEEAMVIELQDHLTEADGGHIDIKFVVDQMTKLRASLSMREHSRRQQQDLERRIIETEKKLALRDEQISKMKSDAEARAEKAANAKAALTSVKAKGGLTRETLAKIEEAAGLL